MGARRSGRPRKKRIQGLKVASIQEARRRYGPTAEQRAKRRALVGPDSPEHLAEYPLGVLFARGLINQEQHEAGCRYARLFRLAIGGESLAGVNLTGKVFDAPGEQDEGWLKAKSLDYGKARLVLFGFGRRTRELVENVTVYQRLPAWLYGKHLPSPGDLKALERLIAGLDGLVLHFRRDCPHAA